MTSFEPPPYPANSSDESAVVIQPLGGLAKALSVLLLMAGAVALVVALAMVDRASVLTDAITDDSVTMLRDVQGADNFVSLVMLAYVLMVLGTGVVFIVWQFRHARNAKALRGHLGLGPGWAIGGWFIPIANLVLPVLQLRHAARASDPALPRGDTHARGQVPGIVTGWVVAYYAAGLIYFAGSQTKTRATASFNREDALSAFVSGDRMASVGMLAYALAAVLATVMVRTLTVRQQQAAFSELTHP